MAVAATQALDVDPDKLERTKATIEHAMITIDEASQRQEAFEEAQSNLSRCRDQSELDTDCSECLNSIHEAIDAHVPTKDVHQRR